MSAARVDYSYSQNFTDEVKRLCEEYKYRLNFKRCRLNESSNDDDEDAEGEHSDPETSLQDEKTTDEEKGKDDSQPKSKEREG